MHTGWKTSWLGILLVLAACGGSSSGPAAPGDVACSGASCGHEQVPPAPLVCGGLPATACPQGYRCVDDPTDSCDPAGGGADCGGICVLGESLPPCGGIAGATCPPDFVCVDDPSDMCDPSSGSADCPGVCQAVAADECATDAECPALRAPCSVCADGTELCPRSFCDDGHCRVDLETCPPPAGCGGDANGCKAGYVCVDDPDDRCDPATMADCASACVPDDTLRRCGGMVGDTCPAGYVCMDDPRDTCSPEAGGADCSGVCEPAPAPQCKADGDCVSILAPCTVCPDGSYACPRAECREGLCVTAIGACAGPGLCGGIAGFPCPSGYTCVDNPNDDCAPDLGGADCGGVCVREEEPRACGGFKGESCPEAYECFDDPRDDCDPADGGADCPGICRPAASPGCKSDGDCPQIGAPCRLCTDGTAACPRSFCDGEQCRAEFPTCVDGSTMAPR